MSTHRLLSTAVLLAAAWASASSSLLGDNGTHRTYSAKTLGHGRLSIGVSGEGAYDENKILGGTVTSYAVKYDTLRGEPYNEEQGRTRINEVFDLTARVFITMGITNYFDLGVSMPIHSDWLTGTAVESNDDLKDASAVGIGDLEIIGKLQYPPYEHDPVFEMAFMGILTLPTGNKDKGFIPKELYYIPKDSVAGTRYYSAQMPTLALLMLNTIDFREINRNVNLQWHLNFGIHSTASPILDNSFLLMSSLHWKPSGEVFGLFLEFSGVTRMSHFSEGFKLGDDPLFLTPGFTVEAENGMSLSLALDWALTQGSELSELRIDPDPGPRSGPLCPECDGDGRYSSYKVKPAAPIGASATLSWTGFMIPQDKDKDGVVDGDDACPTEPEDLDKFQDNDGCPDADNDEDGIEDLDDKCPADAEDLDGYVDEDGCPELDNDGDKINDKKDKCPIEPEDFNNFQDNDGCPDGKSDGDKDGVADFLDKCPTVQEDTDAFQDLDGCPELDNDGDTIPDLKDRCPNAAEIYNGFEDLDGCPDQKAAAPIIIEKIVERRDTIVRKDTVIVEKVIEIEKKATIVLHGVNFGSGSAELTPESFAKLDEVANTLKRSPDIILEISGHTDDKGSAKKNKQLSQERADAVCRYLVSQGAPAAQLRAKGYGSSKPVASNKSAAGREKNRRIEMYRAQ